MVLIRALGPLEVLDARGAPVDLGGRQPRLVLAALLTGGGRAIPVDTLVDAVWGEDPPASALGTLQSYVSRLRRRTGDGLELRLDDAGYRLLVDPDCVDTQRFVRLADEGRAALEAGRPADARRLLTEADALWRGPALAEIADLDIGRGAATRLEERRLSAIEDRIDADLALGRHGALASELVPLVDEHPLREKLREQLATALYRAGRQAEALRALADAGAVLRDQLGIEPSRPLRELETRILNHDSSLDLRQPVAEPATFPAVAEPRPANGFVGREDERAQLIAAFEESSSAARFAVIEGEPGIGKTRLADELGAVAAHRGAVVVWGRSDESGAAPALWPWLVILRTLVERLNQVPPVLADLLSGQAPITRQGIVAGPADAAQYERFAAIAEVLAAVAAETPVVVLLDDMQWADEASLDLLNFLSGRLDRGVLIVATVRQLEVGRNDQLTATLATIARRPASRRLVLRGLSREHTAEMLGIEAAAAGVTTELAAAVHRRADGNPFYAIELARLVGEQGGLAAEIPSTVADVVRRRLQHLPPTTVDLLGVAAVVGRDVALDLLARASDRSLDECVELLEPAVVHRLLVDTPDNPMALRFSHALVREVLVEDLTPLRRARLHLKVADALEATGVGVDEAEILADHLWRAAPVGAGRRAAAALETAADVAMRRVAYATAEDLLTKAAQLRRASSTSVDDQLAELDTLTRLLDVVRSRSYFHAASRKDIFTRARELAERCDRHDTVLDLLWFESAGMQTSRHWQEAARLARELLALTAEDPRPEIRALGEQNYAVWAWGEGRIDEAVERLDRAMELLRDAPPPTNPLVAEIRMITVMFWLLNHAIRGDRSDEETFEDFDGMLDAAPDRLAAASVSGFAASCALWFHAWDVADRFGRAGAAANTHGHFGFWGGQASMQLGIAGVRDDDIEAALHVFDTGRQRYNEAGGRSGMPSYLAAMAIALAERGRLEEARSYVHAAFSELETFGEKWNASIVWTASALVAHAAGDASAAREAAQRAVAVASEQGALGLAQVAEWVAASF